MKSKNELISHFNLKRHPEGGYYAEVHKSGLQIAQAGLPVNFDGPRSSLTSIYFLLEAGDNSNFHRLKSDEIWYFFGGENLLIHVIDPAGKYYILKLGADLDAGYCLQHVVPAGSWFGASVDSDCGFALVGCAVAPGFEFDDFELAQREQLSAEYPQYIEIIKKLTK